MAVSMKDEEEKEEEKEEKKKRLSREKRISWNDWCRWKKTAAAAALHKKRVDRSHIRKYNCHLNERSFDERNIFSMKTVSSSK